MPHIRPLTPDDAEAANAAAAPALDRPESTEPGPAQDFHVGRVRHLAETDPGGAWLAEDDDGRVVGLALALVREGLWGLSLLAVHPDHHGAGLGGRLVRAAHGHGRDARAHVVLASSHPAALRLYVALGLALHPAVSAAGIADLSRAPDLAGRVEEAPLQATEAASRHVRGASHVRDLPVSLRRGSRLLALEDRAWALVAPEMAAVLAVAGRDEEAATAVLWAGLAACGPGATVQLDFLTSAQQWAVRACLQAGLALTPGGAVLLAGAHGPFTPYLPSGAWL